MIACPVWSTTTDPVNDPPTISEGVIPPEIVKGTRVPEETFDVERIKVATLPEFTERLELDKLYVAGLGAMSIKVSLAETPLTFTVRVLFPWKVVCEFVEI